MNRDKRVGAVKDAAGRVQRRIGQATDDPAMAARGAARQIEGKLQKGVGAVRDAVKSVSGEIRTDVGSGSGRKRTP